MTKISGLSESAWKSLVVKAIRLGWPEGLRQAALRLPQGMMKSLLLVQIFEDIFPAVGEIQEVIREVQRLDYEALCLRDTHHGRGWTRKFCELEPVAVNAAESNRDRILHQASQELGVWFPPRAANVYFTWKEIEPRDPGKLRGHDTAPWRGIPIPVLDGHTYEGKVARRESTFLSGHYDKHLKLACLVEDGGWEAVRELAHAAPTLPAEPIEMQETLL